MGNITSTDDRQAKAHSNAIDRDIESSTMKFRKENKILLLGAPPPPALYVPGRY